MKKFYSLLVVAAMAMTAGAQELTWKVTSDFVAADNASVALKTDCPMSLTADKTGWTVKDSVQFGTAEAFPELTCSLQGGDNPKYDGKGYNKDDNFNIPTIGCGYIFSPKKEGTLTIYAQLAGGKPSRIVTGEAYAPFEAVHADGTPCEWFSDLTYAVNGDGQCILTVDVVEDGRYCLVTNGSKATIFGYNFVAKTGGDTPVNPGETTSKTWDFSTWEAGDISSTTTIDGLTLTLAVNPDKQSKFTIDGNKKSYNGVDYTQRLKFGGKSSVVEPLDRVLSFEVPGACDIEVVFCSSSTSGTGRMLNIATGTPDAAPIKSEEAVVSGVAGVVANYTGSEPTTVYISVTGGINIYGISYKVLGGTVGVENVAIDENTPVEYFNLQGVRVANPGNGLYIRRQGCKVSKVIL